MSLNRIFVLLLAALGAGWGWSFRAEQRLKREVAVYQAQQVAPAIETVNREVAAVKEAIRRNERGEKVPIPDLPIAATQAQVLHGKTWLDLNERHAAAIRRSNHLAAAFGFILLAWGATGRLRREWRERGKGEAGAGKGDVDSSHSATGGT